MGSQSEPLIYALSGFTPVWRLHIFTMGDFVQVSFVNGGTGENGGEKIAFNYGRELFVYPYRGVRKAADLTKPIDKRVYKGTVPTCHDFGPVSKESEIVPLVVGFSGGQIQLVDPIRKE